MTPGERALLVRIKILERRIASSGGGDHVSTHQNGGGDELNVGGLSGVLADPQTVATDPAGALGGNGAAGTPLTINVDGTTIIINGDNELEVAASAFSDYVVASDGSDPPQPMHDGFGNFMYIAYTP